MGKERIRPPRSGGENSEFEVVRIWEVVEGDYEVVSKRGEGGGHDTRDMQRTSERLKSAPAGATDDS